MGVNMRTAKARQVGDRVGSIGGERRTGTVTLVLDDGSVLCRLDKPAIGTWGTLTYYLTPPWAAESLTDAPADA